MVDDQVMRTGWFYGRRRQAPLFAALTVASFVSGAVARTVAGAIYLFVVGAWLGAIAWRYWREPVAPHSAVRRRRRRAQQTGRHPLRSAVGTGGVIAFMALAGFWRYGIVSALAVGVVVGALVGLGLYAVFRTDPGFHRGDDGPYDLTGRRRMKSPRWMRRWLEAPDQIDSIWVGPPELRLERRAALLALVRDEIAARGFALEEVRSKGRLRAEGVEALNVVQHDEESADLREHWWTKNLVWRSPDGPSCLVYSPDPDGHDLWFAGWGPAALPCLRLVDELLISEGRT